ncbi:hypothetical protein QJQ45_015383, partial [Haematococcus lacustris]
MPRPSPSLQQLAQPHNLQRTGESMQRPLELCSYEGLEAPPPVGKEYQQGYKRAVEQVKPLQAPRSSQEATPTAASEPGPSTPQPAKRSKRTKAEPGAAEPTKGKGKGKAAKAKPAPQPGRWLDRDCNAALNMQRIGESKWRPLELCYWPDQGALPAKGKEYPGLGYKRLRDKPPKAQQQQQQQQPAEAQYCVPPLLSCHQLTISTCRSCQLYAIALGSGNSV